MRAKLYLANLPTPISRANRLSNELGVNIYFKRDDQTGSEISGNKIRKLEYALKEALDKGATMVITTGGIQSNHCRATTAAATMVGLKVVLLLRISEEPRIEGNFFLDKLFGAEIRYCSPEEYRSSRNEIMKSIADEKESMGESCYIIPEGASNGIGSMGYFRAMEEIVKQEDEIGVKFDTIVVAVGSGGTYSGLCLANKYYELNKRVIGFAVCDDSEYFVNQIDNINREALVHLDKPVKISKNDIEINDKYVGIGYALSTPAELDFIKYLASKEAVVLDPVYTAKAMIGLYNEIKSDNLKSSDNILFIHTGGLFGLFPKQEQFNF
ncbi:MAG: D-cysteine desulfhydrase family protein [Bacteroidetes bacterium HGW-Bacteroidetes-8]|jgi:D-cysteine desulfhydrase|nr:MAG: D-cysteine desulfhydrase family protein [Bacteroidetes bacterium HGW-Bacteroidetes-8]